MVGGIISAASLVRKAKNVVTIERTKKPYRFTFVRASRDTKNVCKVNKINNTTRLSFTTEIQASSPRLGLMANKNAAILAMRPESENFPKIFLIKKYSNNTLVT